MSLTKILRIGIDTHTWISRLCLTITMVLSICQITCLMIIYTNTTIMVIPSQSITTMSRIPTTNGTTMGTMSLEFITEYQITVIIMLHMSTRQCITQLDCTSKIKNLSHLRSTRLSMIFQDQSIQLHLRKALTKRSLLLRQRRKLKMERPSSQLNRLDLRTQRSQRNHLSGHCMMVERYSGTMS